MPAPSDAYLQRFNEQVAQERFETDVRLWLEREFGTTSLDQQDQDDLRF